MPTTTPGSTTPPRQYQQAIMLVAQDLGGAYREMPCPAAHTSVCFGSNSQQMSRKKVETCCDLAISDSASLKSTSQQDPDHENMIEFRVSVCTYIGANEFARSRTGPGDVD